MEGCIGYCDQLALAEKISRDSHFFDKSSSHRPVVEAANGPRFHFGGGPEGIDLLSITNAPPGNDRMQDSLPETELPDSHVALGT